MLRRRRSKRISTKYLLDVLKRDESQDGFSGSVLSNVRALALSALADNVRISRTDLDRHYMHLQEMNLFGKAMFLEALCQVPDTLDMTKRGAQKHSGPFRPEQRDNQVCRTVRFGAVFNPVFADQGIMPRSSWRFWPTGRNRRVSRRVGRF